MHTLSVALSHGHAVWFQAVPESVKFAKQIAEIRAVGKEASLLYVELFAAPQNWPGRQ